MISPFRSFILAVLLFAVLFVTNGVPFIYADGFYYYHTAKSLILEHNFFMTNKPEYYDYRGHAVAFFQDKYVEVVSPGGGLFLLPGLAISQLLRTPEQTIYTDYFLAFNGHTLAEGLAVLVTASLAGLLSLVLIYKALRALGFSERNSIFSTAATYASSYAVWYVFLSPAYTHSYELCAVALFIWGLTGYYRLLDQKYLRWVGFACGLLFLLRPVLAIFGVLVLLVFIFQRQWRGMVNIALAGSPAVIVWLLYNYASYGSWISSGYASVRGETFGSEFHGLDILFSEFRGWFVYSPLMLLAVIGLVLYLRRQRIIAGIALTAAAALVIIYGYWPAWWGGNTFGQRFLLLLVPLMSLGVAHLLRSAGRVDVQRLNGRRVLTSILVLAISVTVTWSLLLTVLYRFTPVSLLRPVGDTVGNMQSVDRYTPVDMLKYHLSLWQQSTGMSDYARRLLLSGNGGISLAALYLGQGDAVLRVDERNQQKTALHLIHSPWGDMAPATTAGYLSSPEGDIYGLEMLLDGAPIEFSCTRTCTAVSDNLQLVRVVDESLSLDRQKFAGVELTGGWKLVVEEPAGLQFKGPVWQLSDKEQVYNLP